MEGIAYLKNKLASKALRVRLRYTYYEMKNCVTDFSRLIPESYSYLSASLGWCAKAVDSLADRIVFDRFDNDDFKLYEIFKLNNGDILFDSAVLSALITSCSFIYVGLDESGYPSLQVIDGANATGIIDPVTNMLTEGYAVLKRDKHDRPILEGYFTPYQTTYYVNGKLDDSLTFNHKAPYALLVPIINRPDAKRPFGHSRISRAAISLTQSALRTLRRSEISAEYYAFPQKYVLGLSEDAEFNNNFARFSSFLDLRKDDDGDKPTVGQFSQSSMAPFIDQMKMIASMFAGETGLTLDDLGFNTQNPTSAEAIKASHESLRLMAKKAQRTFGSGFLNAGYLAACLRDDYTYERKAFANTSARYLPLFEPDAAALGAIGDSVYKINSAIPGYIASDTLRQLTGIEGDVSDGL